MSDPIELTVGTRVRINIAGIKYVGEVVSCWKQGDVLPQEGKTYPDGTVIHPVQGSVGDIKLTIRVDPNQGAYSDPEFVDC